MTNATHLHFKMSIADSNGYAHFLYHFGANIRGEIFACALYGDFVS